MGANDGFVLPDLLLVKAEKARRKLHYFVEHFAWPELQAGTPFVDNWHIHAICDHLEAIKLGQIRRLIINLPFRMLKSTIISQAFPAWEWIDQAHLQYFTACYSKDLATRDAVNSRKVIESSRYQSVWGHKFRMTSDQNVKTRYENDQNGSRAVVSTESSGTGLGGNRIIWDDPLSAHEAKSPTARLAAIAFWQGTLTTRLNNPAVDATIIVHQRLATDDPTGFILANEGAEDWDHLVLPMRYSPKIISISSIGYTDPRKEFGELLFPSRLDEKTVKSLETSLGSRNTAAQLQQQPVDSEGGLFQREWFSIIDEMPDCAFQVVRGWDLAGTTDEENNKSPFTAGVKLARTVTGEFIIMDVKHGRWSPADVEKTIVTTAKSDGPACEIDIPQDPGQAGKMQVRYFIKQLAGFTAHYSPETGSKITRAEPVASQAEAYNIKLLRGKWNNLFLDEAEGNGFMDQIDALSRAFHRLVRNTASNDDAPVAPQVVETTGAIAGYYGD